MKARGEESMTVTVETTRRCEVIEMHLFDENASREMALRRRCYSLSFRNFDRPSIAIVPRPPVAS